MILLLIASLLALLAGWFSIPADVRELIDENCRGGNGRIRLRYLWRESLGVLNFYTGVLFFAVVIAASLLLAILLIDYYLLPMEVVQTAARRAEGWSERDRFLTALREGHLSWFIGRGGDAEAAVQVQRILLLVLPLLSCVAFVAIACGMRLTSRSYNAALEQLVSDEVRLNRRRITARYLRDTAQSHWQE